MMKNWEQYKIDRKQILKNKMVEDGVDGILFHSSINRQWFTNFSTTEGYLLFSDKAIILYLDGRYITAGKEQAANVDEIKLMPTNSQNAFIELLSNDLKNNNIKTLGFESEYTNFDEYFKLKTQLKNFVLKPMNVNQIRTIKDGEEIQKINGACEIADKAFASVLKKIKSGMREKEIEAIIASSFILNGADGVSFNSIVVSGKRGALPHGRATNKIIEKGDYVTIDFGCIFEGYCSDTTRTICIEQDNSKMNEIYAVVAQAQKLGIEAVKPGVTTKQIDDICREYITKAGYGEYFIHSTGHGLGVEVHEFPRVSPFCDVPLKPGMVITVEPGIYIPDLGGVRIEDDILVTFEGYEVLSKAPKTLDKPIIV
ncbi:aminopeptidase P family protein [Spiroplasma endosymbiont of Amphibalanus improvisus]|uniref:M24 family metallopeptidase n=1 Tax=Spiroplasma endosymbiont of Amphibalanus improvisus TaxID=3066327 RepID=UPI00313D272A